MTNKPLQTEELFDERDIQYPGQGGDQMKINYHIHTAFSGDMACKGRLDETPEKCARIAVEKGFDEICFTDHLSMGYARESHSYGYSMDPGRLDEYFHAIAAAGKRFPQIKIRAGIEADWLPEKINELEKVISRHPFDCVLGSVHFVNGTIVEHEGDEIARFWGRLSSEEVYKRHVEYYLAVQEMAKSRLFDVAAHLDLVKRDGCLPKRSVMPVVRETVRVIAENGLCVEVNTSGLKKPIREMHPSPRILRMCRKKKIPVTIGTDAHRAEMLDFHLEDGMKLIKEAGYRELAVFEKRKMHLVGI